MNLLGFYSIFVILADSDFFIYIYIHFSNSLSLLFIYLSYNYIFIYLFYFGCYTRIVVLWIRLVNFVSNQRQINSFLSFKIKLSYKFYWHNRLIRIDN